MHEMSCLSRDLPTETAVMCAILNFRSFFGDSRPIWTTLAATNFDRSQKSFFIRRLLNAFKGMPQRIWLEHKLSEKKP